jgi:hypothetical protein
MAAKKKIAAKKPVKKGPPPKKAAPAKKPVKKGPPPKAAKPVVKKPVVKKGPPPKAPVKKKTAAAAKPAKDPVSNYRKLRKWTLPKLEPLLAADFAGSIRQRIRSTLKGALLASELFKYLKALESEMPDWAEKAKAKGGKRGRPPKAAAVKKTAPLPKPVAPAAAKDIIAQAAAGKLLVRPPVPKVVVAGGPPRPVVVAGGPPRLRLVVASK